MHMKNSIASIFKKSVFKFKKNGHINFAEAYTDNIFKM